MSYEVGDILEIYGRGDGWDGVQVRVTKAGDDANCYVVAATFDSPVDPPRNYKRGLSVGVWTHNRLRPAPILEVSPETYEID